MARSENEKSLGNVGIELFERIDKAVSCRNNTKKKQFVTAAMDFFLALPDHVIDTLLLHPPDSEAFVNIVNRFRSEQSPGTERPQTLSGATAAVEDDAAAVKLAAKMKHKHGQSGSSRSA